TKPPGIAPVMDCAPVPSFPAVRIVDHAGTADIVEELLARTQKVAQVSPAMVGAAAAHDRARPVLGLDPYDLRGNDLVRLLPADPLVSRGAAILRVSPAVRIEVFANHGIKIAILGVNHRSPGQSVGVQRCFPWRTEFLSPGFDGPRGC